MLNAVQIPFVVPVRTGVVMLEGDAASSGTNEIVTLMGHSEVALRVNLPGRFSFKISWYQGMEGFTGWHGGVGPHVHDVRERDTVPAATFSHVACSSRPLFSRNAEGQRHDYRSHVPRVRGTGGFPRVAVALNMRFVPQEDM